jgi:chromate transporter
MHSLTTDQLLALFTHFLSLSMLATGGAIALASDMHRYVVDEHAFITHTQFVNSIALAQAAPGPNMMFITVMGWQIAGAAGALATTLGLVAPSLVFPFVVSRLGRLSQFQRTLDAFKRGLAPVALGLLASTCWLLVGQSPDVWQGAVFTVITIVFLQWSRVPAVLLIFLAGGVGAFLTW